MPRLRAPSPPTVGMSGLVALTASWGFLHPAIQGGLDTTYALTVPPAFGLGSSVSFLWYFVACLNRRSTRWCMAVNKRESENEFCHNPAEKNRISCKALRREGHGLLSWRKRWREQRPDDPIPPLRVELFTQRCRSR